MKMLKNIINKYFNLENVALLLIAFSSFFMGGENLYIKYFIVVFLFFIFLLKQKIDIKKYDILLYILLIGIFSYNLIIQNYNSDLYNFGLLFFIFVLFKNLDFKKKYFSNLIILSSVFHSIIVFYQSIFLNKFRPPSTFVNPNWVVIWLFTGLYFLLFENNFIEKHKIIKIPVSLLFIMASILTLSRTTIVLFILFIGYIIFYKKDISRNLKIIFGILAVLILLIPVIRFSRNKEAVSFKRLDFYNAGLKLYSQKPLLGNGIKTVENKIKKYYKGEKRQFSNYSKSPRMSHNVFLEILIEMGIIALVLIVYILYNYFKSSYLKLPLMIFFVSALFNNIEKSFSLVLLFFIVLSFNKIPIKKKLSINKEYKCIVFFTILYFFTFKMLSYIYIDLGKKYFKEKKYKKSFNYYKQSANFTKYDPYYQRIYLRFLINLPKNSLIDTTWEKRFYQIEKIYNRLKKYDRFDSENYDIYAYYCLKILRSDKFSKMKPEIWNKGLKTINKAIKINPKNPFYYYKKMYFHYMRNNNKKAKELAKSAIQLEPYFLRGYKILLKIDNNIKNKEKYKKMIKKIRSIKKNKYKLNQYEKRLLQE